jgi:hypothetical protein
MDWREVTVYEDRDLENTVLDCHVCHQPAGHGTKKILRMPSLQLPWPHWILDVAKVAVRPPGTTGLRVPNNGRISGLSGINFDSNRDLLRDFLAAHKNDGEYAGIPIASVELSAPNELANFLVERGFSPQPNEASEIASTPIGPFPVIYPGKSAGWRRAYAASLTGDELSPPFPAATVTSSTLLATMTREYLDAISGKIEKRAMPDIRDVFLRDAGHELGFSVAPEASGSEILDQACKLCHHDGLNQNISRAKFDVDLRRLDRQTRKVAIERLLLPKDDAKRMPPTFYKELSKAEISRLKSYLEESGP